MMLGATENRRAVKPANFRETTNRRALKDLNNYDGALHPCAVNKRQFLEKDVACAKTLNVLPQRPMTRKFAAALANKSQPTNEETSKGHVHVTDNKKLSRPVTIDVDILPMVVDSEEMECELPKETDMEDLEMDSALDIDMCDVGNPLSVADYVGDIYNYYKRVEETGCVNPDYMSNQFDINDKMRAILIDWLIEVHYKFELMEETLYLIVNIIDRFLSLQSIIRKKLQLVGVTAMLLACKYEEVSVPVIDDLILISDRAYTRDDVLDMEKLMVKTLKFDMSVPTPYVFMRRFLKAAESDKKLELLSYFIIELSLIEYGMLKFQPSLLAAAAIYTAQCCLKGFRCWTKTSELYTNYTEDQLLECSKMMVNFHQNAGSGKLRGVHRKYSTVKFGCAAKSDPALFLLNIIP